MKYSQPQQQLLYYRGKVRVWYLGNTSGGVCSDLSGLPNILNWAKFLWSPAMKPWYLPNVPLPWGAGLWERAWPATMCFNTAESRARTALALCFWMCLAQGRKFCWERLAKGTRNLHRRHREGWWRRRNAGRGSVVWPCKQELLHEHRLRHCAFHTALTCTARQGNFPLSYHNVLYVACKKHTWRGKEQLRFSSIALCMPEIGFRSLVASSLC